MHLSETIGKDKRFAFYDSIIASKQGLDKVKKVKIVRSSQFFHKYCLDLE